MSTLGSRLRELRGELTLYEVAKATGISRGELGCYEKGEHLPSPRNLNRLAEYYEVSYEELRKLYYDDYFSDPVERRIVLAWASEALSRP